MAKKKFSEGLDDLFSNEATEQQPWGHASDSPARERKSGSKTFMDDLDELFHEALDESLRKLDVEPSAAATTSTKSKSTGAYRAPLSGLDALIRQTVDIQEIAADESSGKKRLTVAIDGEKLQQLKAIARLENAYLKDVVVQLIDEYIREYSDGKGVDF